MRLLLTFKGSPKFIIMWVVDEADEPAVGRTCDDTLGKVI